MKTPKYNLGDAVWILIDENWDCGLSFSDPRYKAVERKIKSIESIQEANLTTGETEASRVRYGFERRDMTSLDYTLPERSCFPTREELLKSL